MTTKVAEKHTTDRIEMLRQRLEELLADDAPEHEIAAAENKLAVARHRAQRNQERLQERAEIARGVALKKASETEQQRQEAAARAERAMREGAAPRITVEYAGLRLVFTPELVGEMVSRRTAYTALQQSLVSIERHLETAIGAARAQAKGLAAPAVLPVARLRLQLEDIMRHALKHGTVTIEEGRL